MEPTGSGARGSWATAGTHGQTVASATTAAAQTALGRMGVFWSEVASFMTSSSGFLALGIICWGS